MLDEARCAESRFGVLLRNPNRVIIQLPIALPKGQAPLPCREHAPATGIECEMGTWYGMKAWPAFATRSGPHLGTEHG
jgi:hypothetical protein